MSSHRLMLFLLYCTLLCFTIHTHIKYQYQYKHCIVIHSTHTHMHVHAHVHVRVHVSDSIAPTHQILSSHWTLCVLQCRVEWSAVH